MQSKLSTLLIYSIGIHSIARMCTKDMKKYHMSTLCKSLFAAPTIHNWFNKHSMINIWSIVETWLILKAITDFLSAKFKSNQVFEVCNSAPSVKEDEKDHSNLKFS